MATDTLGLQIPSSNRIVPGSKDVVAASYPEGVDVTNSDPQEIANQWLSSFNELVKGETTDVSPLFLQNSYWRDFLCLSWDYHTLHGPEKVTSLIQGKVKKWRIHSLALDDSNAAGKPTIAPFNVQGDIKGVQFFTTVDTDVGRGRGLVRLFPDSTDNGRWKAYTLFTALRELKGHEELNRARRPQGVDHGAQAGRKNWQEKRIAEQNLEGEKEEAEPVVLIVGKMTPSMKNNACPTGSMFSRTLLARTAKKL